MKQLYLVRHGESEEVRDEVYWGPEQSLTERGFFEAQKAGERFKTIPVDALLTSPWKRAVQTAEEIQKSIDIIPEEYAPLHEVEVPRALYGKKKSDPAARAFQHAKKEHLDDAAWRYAEEETFLEVTARVGGALLDLSRRSEDRILLVTHHKIIKYMLGLVLFGEAFTPRAFHAIYSNLTVSPAGITLFVYHNNAWNISVVNDAAHLGEA